MPRSYRHIKEYELEILELKSQGMSNREICERFGLELKQLKNFINRYNTNRRKLEAGILLKRKGRPRKDGTELPLSVQRLSKFTQLQYEIASKERYIKQLEMENELMRDFLSLTERK